MIIMTQARRAPRPKSVLQLVGKLIGKKNIKSVEHIMSAAVVVKG